MTASDAFPLVSRIRSSRFFTVVVLLWVLVLLGIFGRALARPNANTVFTTYQKAGAKWLKGKRYYKKQGGRGFVYSPLAAASFAPYAALPTPLATIAWRLLNTGVFVGAVAWWLRKGMYRGITRKLEPWLFLLLLPLTLGNINIAQVNPLIIGLLMMAIVACEEKRWFLAALCVGIPTYFKIYPLAIGLLLVVLHPRQFSWRLALTLVGMGLLTFILQKPSYVLEMHRQWIATRSADNRFEYEDVIASRDLWMVFRFLHIPITQKAYQLLQVATGAAIAVVVLYGKVKAWSRDRILVALFSLSSAWMILLGPSTESATYVMLAPAVAFSLVQAFGNPKVFSPGMRLWISLALAVELLALALNAFIRMPRTPPFMAIQPIGALIYLGYAIASLRSRYWPEADQPASPAMLEAKEV